MQEGRVAARVLQQRPPAGHSQEGHAVGVVVAVGSPVPAAIIFWLGVRIFGGLRSWSMQMVLWQLVSPLYLQKFSISLGGVRTFWGTVLSRAQQGHAVGVVVPPHRSPVPAGMASDMSFGTA